MLLKYINVPFYQGPWKKLCGVLQQRCFHQSPAAYGVAMSKFDKASLPYAKLEKNLEVIRKRYIIQDFKFFFLSKCKYKTCFFL